MIDALSSPWLRSLGAGVVGFIVYGSWACYANSAHGAAVAAMAGLLQGGYSLVLTFVTTLLMEQLFRWFKPWAFRVTATVAATGLVLLSVPWLLHTLAGTPERLLTILPGFLIGMVYTGGYVLGLERLDRAA